MTTIWEIDETVAPVEPAADSLAGGVGVPELTTEDREASAAGVQLPEGAEGAPS